MKRVLSIQDLSCVGRCSLTVALPVLSAMGVECAAFPTAVLSTHTGFPGPAAVSLTGQIAGFAAHWKKLGICFDAITTGYLADPAQAEAVLRVLEDFGKTVIVDPAMGDHGKLYSGLGPGHTEAMKALCRRGDFLLPNVTEAALLTGLPYRDKPDASYLAELAAGLLELGAQAVVITGVLWEDGQIGFSGCDRSTGGFSYRGPYVPRQFHGTGDLFTAVFTGGVMAGLSAPHAGALAAEFVRRAAAGTQAVTPFGVEFERELPWLAANMTQQSGK